MSMQMYQKHQDQDVQQRNRKLLESFSKAKQQFQKDSIEELTFTNETQDRTVTQTSQEEQEQNQNQIWDMSKSISTIQGTEGGLQPSPREIVTNFKDHIELIEKYITETKLKCQQFKILGLELRSEMNIMNIKKDKILEQMFFEFEPEYKNLKNLQKQMEEEFQWNFKKTVFVVDQMVEENNDIKKQIAAAEEKLKKIHKKSGNYTYLQVHIEENEIDSVQEKQKIIKT